MSKTPYRDELDMGRGCKRSDTDCGGMEKRCQP
jgi:hypothetical protein